MLPRTHGYKAQQPYGVVVIAEEFGPATPYFSPNAENFISIGAEVEGWQPIVLFVHRLATWFDVDRALRSIAGEAYMKLLPDVFQAWSVAHA